MSKLDWKGLLDHLIIVEGECMEENYGEGCGANESDEECNAGIRRAYDELVKVQPVLMAAPELLAALHLAADALDYAQAQVDSENDAHNLRVRLVQVKRVIAKAEGQGS
jgi:hypothetical protein